MNQITKKDIVNTIYNQLNIKKKDIAPVVDMAFSVIADNLAQGNVVEINGFGKFLVTERAARNGVNPSTGRPMTVAPTKQVKFRPSETLKRGVKK